MNGTEAARHLRNINVLNTLRDRKQPYMPAIIRDYQLIVQNSKAKDLEIDELQLKVQNLKARLAKFGVWEDEE